MFPIRIDRPDNAQSKPGGNGYDPCIAPSMIVAGYDKKQGYPDPGEDLAAFEARGLGRSSTVVEPLPLES